jgi:hypothetical protein
MVNPEDIGVVKGYYLDAEGNGYKVVSILRNEKSTEHVVLYHKIKPPATTLGEMFFLQVGSFEREVDSQKGYQYSDTWPRMLGLGAEPGSRIDQTS